MKSEASVQKMAETQDNQGQEEDVLRVRRLVSLSITAPQYNIDIFTISGLFIALALIVAALFVGGSPQAFVNPAALMIVVGGTAAVTAISFISEDLAKLGQVLWGTIAYHVRAPSQVAKELVDVAVMARQKGVLALSGEEQELGKDEMIREAVEYIVDGFETEKIQAIMSQDIESTYEQSRKSAGILRRAAEIAPAMGLIGTLVGLVQMLSFLKDPGSIGPAMAIALLTTFYGALLGTVILGPLAAKVDRKAQQTDLLKRLVMTAALSISSKENPRQLEIQLNALLPADQRIIYFS